MQTKTGSRPLRFFHSALLPPGGHVLCLLSAQEKAFFLKGRARVVEGLRKPLSLETAQSGGQELLATNNFDTLSSCKRRNRLS